MANCGQAVRNQASWNESQQAERVGAWARLRSVSGAASVKRLPRVQIQANMLGLRIQSGEVFLVFYRQRL